MKEDKQKYEEACKAWQEECVRGRLVLPEKLIRGIEKRKHQIEGALIMIKIAVCDDEKIYSDRICKCISKELANHDISDYDITVYNSGMEFAAEEDNLLEYHMIFLDINMPNVNGFELAKNIKDRNSNIYIIFVTSFLNYAIQGYRFDALRFILKSDIDNLMPECIETVVRLMRIDYHEVEYDFVEGKQEIITNQLMFIENIKHKLIFNFSDNEKNLSLYKKLDEIEKDLEGYGFLRIHKSYLVNVVYIKKLINYGVVLRGGRQLPIPREKIKQVREKYFEMRGDRF